MKLNILVLHPKICFTAGSCARRPPYSPSGQLTTSKIQEVAGTRAYSAHPLHRKPLH